MKRMSSIQEIVTPMNLSADETLKSPLVSRNQISEATPLGNAVGKLNATNF
jgi:hypothetical protein